MPIDIKQLNQSELSGFVSGILGGTYRAIIGNNVVYTDNTNQTVSGFKTFRNPPNVPYAGTTGQVPSLRYVNDKVNQASGDLNNKITTISGFNFFNFAGDFSTSGFYNPYDAVYYQGSTYGYTGTISFNGAKGTPLSGAWHILAASGSGIQGPIGNFINSGTLTGAFFDASFFIDIPLTGLNIMETFVSHSGALTGYALGCHTSGTSGGPLSGSIYTRNLSNVKTNLLNFSMNTGVLLKTGTMTGNFDSLYRIGVDLYSGISGMQGFTIGLFGMEWGG